MVFTPEQYLGMDRASESRSEYLNGHVYAMAGGSRAHAYLTLAIGSELRQALRNRGCHVGGPDLRVRISTRGPYFYPDATVTCGGVPMVDEHDDISINPTVIVEVLSKSTEAFDRGAKFAEYRRLDSLQEYVLVSQTEPRIEIFLRQPEGKWILTEFVGLEAECRLASVNCTIPLAAIYEGITLASA